VFALVQDYRLLPILRENDSVTARTSKVKRHFTRERIILNRVGECRINTFLSRFRPSPGGDCCAPLTGSAPSSLAGRRVESGITLRSFRASLAELTFNLSRIGWVYQTIYFLLFRRQGLGLPLFMSMFRFLVVASKNSSQYLTPQLRSPNHSRHTQDFVFPTTSYSTET
jgi:hypothetical protein